MIYLAQIAGGKEHASCNILLVNNNSLEDFALRFLFCREINQLLEQMYGQEAHDLQFKFNNLFIEHFSKLIF